MPSCHHEAIQMILHAICAILSQSMQFCHTFLWLKTGNIVAVIIKILFMYYIKEFCHSFHKDEPFENFQ